MILVSNNKVIFEGEPVEVLEFLNFRIDEVGNVYLNNYQDTINYSLKDYSLDEIKKDFLKYRFEAIIKYSNLKIYK